MLQDFLDLYSPATAKVNGWVLNEAAQHIGKSLEQATQEDAISYQKSIANLSSNTRKRKLSTLSAYFKYLMKRGLRTSNPTDALRLPKTDRLRSIKWLRREEVDTLVDSTTGQERAILLAGLSGLRLSEIASLNVEQLHDGRLWNVEGKGNKVRTVPLTDEANDALMRWVAGRTKGAMFSLQRGKRISPRSIQNVVYGASTKALGRRVNVHALRHTHATLLAKADVPVLKIGRILGHANPAITEIYLHLDDEDLVNEVKKLDRPAKPALRLVHSA